MALLAADMKLSGRRTVHILKNDTEIRTAIAAMARGNAQHVVAQDSCVTAIRPDHLNAQTACLKICAVPVNAAHAKERGRYIA